MANKLLSAPADRFDALNKTYVTASGTPVKFKPIGPGAIDFKRKQFEGMQPDIKPPVLEINHGKGRISEVPNLKDENYLEQKAVRDANAGRLLVEWIFSTGLDATIPDKPEPGSVFEAVLEDQGDLTKVTRRYLYFNSIMDANDYAFLLEAIVGQQGVTQLGLAKAADEFQDNS